MNRGDEFSGLPRNDAWIIPSRHAEIRSEDSEFIVQDAGSRNGVAIAVRGERTVKVGQRVLLGDQTLRLESM